jgi:nitrate/nitrite-specific signal transduction histidine kinase
MADRDDLARRSQEFFQLLGKQKDFIEGLLKENERLRFAGAMKDATEAGADARLHTEIEQLQLKVAQLEAEKNSIEARFRQVEEENKDFAQRYLEIEEQNNGLANLYVASYQLHSTLDFKEVMSIVLEIVINLIGAEVFAVMLVDERTNELGMVASEGLGDEFKSVKVRIGERIAGTVAKSGEPYFITQNLEKHAVDFHAPIACIPLKIKEHVIGVIAIHKLLVQKDHFSPVDFELFTLLAGHAATAIFSSRLYSQSERKLTTIQGFLDLLTTAGTAK